MSARPLFGSSPHFGEQIEPSTARESPPAIESRDVRRLDSLSGGSDNIVDSQKQGRPLVAERSRGPLQRSERCRPNPVQAREFKVRDVCIVEG